MDVFLEIENQGSFHSIIPSKDKNKDCVYCGQCVVHCPSGTFSSVDPSLKIEEEIKNNKYVKRTFYILFHLSRGGNDN